MRAHRDRTRGSIAAGLLLLATPLAAGLVALAPAPVDAQSEPLFGQRSSADFLFGAPRVTLGIRGGYAMPREGGDVLEDVRGLLTLNRGDLASATFGAELGIRLTERLDLALGFESTSESEETEYHGFVGSDDLPVLQTITLARRPLTASLKYYLMDRGRTISRLAWVPRKWSPYVGAGAGYMKYDFEIEGEFIDFSTDPMEIFVDRAPAEGWTPMYQALGGVNVSLNPRLFVTFEGRYQWAEGDPGQYFDGFDSIDLSGASAVLGLSVRF